MKQKGRTPGTNRMPSGSCNVSECEFPKEVDIIYGRGTGRLHAPSMARIGCREHRVRSSLNPDHFLREYQHSPTNSFQKAFCPFRESCFPKTCSNPVAAAVYKNKLTVSRRRYLARVLSSLMYRYVCARAKAMSAFLIYCHGYGDFRPITSLTCQLTHFPPATV